MLGQNERYYLGTNLYKRHKAFYNNAQILTLKVVGKTEGNMKKVHSFALGLAIITATLISVGGSPQDTAAAATNTKKVEVYTYTAQQGDSYSQFARKAVQTYGISEKVKLSPAQIVYVETNLTQVAASPYLEVEQKASIAKSDVKAWVEKAQKLSDSEKAAWASYVPYIDFDTKNVGEAS